MSRPRIWRAPAPRTATWVRGRLEALGFWRPDAVMDVIVEATVAALNGADVVLVGPSARALLPTWRIVLHGCGYTGEPVAAFSEDVWFNRREAGIEEADVKAFRVPVSPGIWL
jgi:hypothetical protein